MEIPFNLFISLIAAGITNIVQIIVFVVLYKTLKAVHLQNKSNAEHFKSQMNIEKNALTFTFADWIASEVKYYSPLYKENKQRDYILSKETIDKHLTAIGRKIVTMSSNNTIDVDILKDEIERLVLTLDNMDKKPTHIISDLKKLLNDQSK